MKKEASKEPTKEQNTEIKALAELPDEEIDTSDIPEILDRSDAKRALLYRPVKQQITPRLETEIVAWFRANAPGACAGEQLWVHYRTTCSVSGFTITLHIVARISYGAGP